MHSSSDGDGSRTNTFLRRYQDTTKTFKDVMTLRAENLKGNEDRRKLFTGTPDDASPFGGRQGAISVCIGRMLWLAAVLPAHCKWCGAHGLA